MKLVYASHTETVVGDKKSVTTEKLDKMLLAIAKKMYDDPRLKKSFREILDILNKAKAENH